MGDSLAEVRNNPDTTPFNLWRRETPGAADWVGSARPGAPQKYFMFSADCHAVEPGSYLDEIEPEYRHRTPHIENRDDGSQWLITEGNRPQRVRKATVAAADGASAITPAVAANSPLDAEDVLRNSSGRTVAVSCA